jgi:hypothetical protein
MPEKAIELARLCTDTVRNGITFPTVWSTVLNGHPLVEGIPRHRFSGNPNLLVIPLVTRQQLEYDADAKEFRVR